MDDTRILKGRNYSTSSLDCHILLIVFAEITEYPCVSPNTTHTGKPSPVGVSRLTIFCGYATIGRLAVAKSLGPRMPVLNNPVDQRSATYTERAEDGNNQ